MTLFSKMAIRNLWKNKRRSISTGMAILAGFAGLCLLGGYILRVEKYLAVNSIYINHSGHLAIYKKGGLDFFYNNPRKYHLKGEDLQKLQELLANDKEVEFTAPILQGMGLISNGNKSVPFLAYGIEPDVERRIQSHPEVHKWTHELVPASGELSIKDAKGELAETISITKELGSLIGKNPPFNELSLQDKDVQLAARSFESDLNAVNAHLGFKHSTGFSMLEDTGLVAPLSVMQSLYATEGATFIAVYLHPGTNVGNAVKRIQKAILDAQINAEAYPFDDDRIGLFYTGSMGFLYIMAGFFVFLIFGAVALSIVNSMTIGILERVREIGTLRAIGFTDSQTAWLFTLESLFLTAISIVIGYVATQIIALIVNGLNLRFSPPGIAGDMQFVVTPFLWVCILVAIPIMIICMICAYLVSKKLVNKPIIQLLQQVN
ncbi:ABC transporter permease [Bdellovibrio sp. HCB337]|uniref:ABC transporter permease n=1 Tax=Bdellovibrio sp. HCB337 TaxID=3394358 RepID=UPI0039A6D2CC